MWARRAANWARSDDNRANAVAVARYVVGGTGRDGTDETGTDGTGTDETGRDGTGTGDTGRDGTDGSDETGRDGRLIGGIGVEGGGRVRKRALTSRLKCVHNSCRDECWGARSISCLFSSNRDVSLQAQPRKKNANRCLRPTL